MSWLDHLDIQVMRGSVLAQDVNAIGFAVQAGLNPYGTVCRALLNRAPGVFRAELDAARVRSPAFRIGQAEVLDGRRMGLRAPHVVVVGIWGHESTYRGADLEKAYTAAIRKALKCDAKEFALAILAAKPWENRMDEYVARLDACISGLDRTKASDQFSIHRLAFVTPSAQFARSFHGRLDALLPGVLPLADFGSTHGEEGDDDDSIDPA
jgi:hypothetical protein